ncbi:MAG: alanine racemase [Myxococcota bacterium]
MIDWEQTAAVHGTPYYLYALQPILARIALFRRLFPHYQLLYAVKANPAVGLMAKLSTSLDGADVASAGEMERAERAGWTRAAVSFAGPGKTDADLVAASGAGLLVLESLEELDRLSALGLPCPPLLLRVNPKDRVQAFAVPIAGLPSPFGFDEEDLGEALAGLAARGAAEKVRGIHVHAGSQCSSPAAYARLAKAARSIAQGLRRQGLPLQQLCLGGGLGAPEGLGQQGMDLQALRTALAEVFGPAPELILSFELGRALLAEAGTYVVRVLRVKRSRGKRIAVVDGGIHQLLRAAPALGGPRKPKARLRNLSAPERPEVEMSLSGPLCTPLDVLAEDVLLPEPQPGDLLAIEAAGAYGLSMSPIEFLSRPRPRELLLEADGLSVLG